MSKRRNKKFSNTKALQYGGLAVLAAVTIGVVGLSLHQQAPPPSSTTVSYTPAPATLKPVQRSLKVAFVGDSYSAGAGATGQAMRWTSVLSRQMDWVETNLARGGTGYLATAGKTGCGLDYCPRYEEMIPDVVKAAPDLVIVSGGRNDNGAEPGAREAATASFFKALRAALPASTKIAVTSPLWDSRDAPASIGAMAESIRANAESVGATYIDIGQPLAGHPEMIGQDKVHPVDSGYAAIAAAVRTGLEKVPALTEVPKG